MVQQSYPKNPVIATLLAGILVALVSLVYVVARNGGPKTVDTKTSRIRAIADPDRIRETLQLGKTYLIVLKAGITARVEDKDWGVKTITDLAYAGEMQLTRTIEANDGQKIVELRRFDVCRSVKLLYEVADVEIQLGPAGHLALGILEQFEPGLGAVILVAKPVTEAILGVGAQKIADSQKTKAFGLVDGLSGKSVRITYVDGIGVESITPVGCTLTEAEREFVFHTAVLSDCYLFPDVKIEPGGTWEVDGSQLIGFLDPSFRGIPQGTITIAREPNINDEQDYAELRIQSGMVRINRSDDSRLRIGTFTPRGTLRYSLAASHVETAELTGEITIDEISKDHLLFEASFKTQPKMEISYSCRMVP